MGDAMPDLVVRHIDDAMAERIKVLARKRGWSVNEVVLHALRYGLGMAIANPAARTHAMRKVTQLGGTWDAEETAAFQDALDALAAAEPEQLAGGRGAHGAEKR
jgi:hypothetical protein